MHAPCFLVEELYHDSWLDTYQNNSKLVYWLLQMGPLLSDYQSLQQMYDIQIKAQTGKSKHAIF